MCMCAYMCAYTRALIPNLSSAHESSTDDAINYDTRRPINLSNSLLDPRAMRYSYATEKEGHFRFYDAFATCYDRL